MKLDDITILDNLKAITLNNLIAVTALRALIYKIAITHPEILKETDIVEVEKKAKEDMKHWEDLLG